MLKMFQTHCKSVRQIQEVLQNIKQSHKRIKLESKERKVDKSQETHSLRV